MQSLCRPVCLRIEVPFSSRAGIISHPFFRQLAEGRS